MKANLSLEFIGADTYDYLRTERLLASVGIKIDPEDRVSGGPWVAELRLNASGDIRPIWVYGNRDYARANSKGTRGVMVNFILEQYRLYLINEPRSWKSVIRYHAAVTATGDIKILTIAEAEEWRNAL